MNVLLRHVCILYASRPHAFVQCAAELGLPGIRLAFLVRMSTLAVAIASETQPWLLQFIVSTLG